MFRRKSKKTSEVDIQLTALVDVLTILLVFFMVQQSTSSENIKMKDRIQLPMAENAYDTQIKENVNVIISDGFIKVGETQLLQLSQGKFSVTQTHEDDSEFISALHDKITNDKEWSDKKEFQWVLLADEKVPYETIKKTIYTLAISGFTKIKLASTTGSN